MQPHRESMFLSSIRSFCVALFSILGIAVGIVVVVLLVAIVFGSTKEPAVSYDYVQYSDENGDRNAGVAGPVILWLDVDGAIGTDQLNADNIAIQLLESRQGLMTNRIKGMFLHINSPGGTVIDADKIYASINEYKARFNIPVYAFVDGMCASGGMYVACSADKIYASEVSIIGSVGVYGRYFNVATLMDKMGVKCLTLKAGKHKDAMSPFEPWVAGEEANDQSIVNFYYDHFVDIVTKARPKITKEDLTQKYGANVYVAEQALAYGYIDVVSPSYNKCMADLARASGIKEDESYQVYGLESSNWLQSLVKSESPVLTGKVTHQIKFDEKFPCEFTNQCLYYYQP
ncbi:MAG: S49 family peptidase [Parachlamydiales bacterium]|nr:S49 family peptidase [Parachlamydiales bacterium]